ncbi:M28 family peptidase [Akkermansiaceae bacterium]|nr:M28 family peptidase [Akkermansiaceae bacterium]MDB4444905.1 M28 family peptidase [Akkermansiaceae bacterium]MDB4500156.1 M28 family peptidase [Akkermansiaceae bacterium]MDC0291330.1 M28 family peptidase [Akkermansiaceae bacterium]
MNKNQNLADKLERDVRELCISSGRRVGTEGHKLAGKWVERRLQEIGCIPYIGETFSLPYEVEGIGFVNYAGVITGRDRSLSPVLIGAHYDSVIDAPCADDNGASVAISLSVAEAMIKCGGLERDLLVVIFDAEEPPYFQSECMGSIRFYEDQIDERGIHFAVISDLVGHDVTFPDSVTKRLPAAKILTAPFAPLTFMTGAESHPALPKVLEAIKTPKGMKLIATLNEYVGDMSDHGIFRINNIPYVFLSCGRWEHYHQPSDTPEKLNYKKMAAITEYCRTICETAARTGFSSSERLADSLDYEMKTWDKALGLMRRPLAKMLGVPDFNNRKNINKAASSLSNLGL